ncbi:SH2 domain and p53-like transcription factor, DNA-binding domain and EF-hand domain pair and STAT transcription factor, DNA-binding, subdomain and STAT transcription factor, all-alpha domain and STAT transcription factor, DNA-binding domain and STAT transcription factor, coiled coil domain-containing protein [Strongyloides ratti]|uniref:SH2 domain-containing protein n=1 Tax=Strongyloides ratti TaxID=34506 RepID=A0A090LN21_STRRB|nr:SH2 domain and p53-like transcription factor, DNA-binding domain and EF-hand domain pair and STAT transcription factor, DNA-binding, subdomain and STAT transcription factor, all-alpha domain and STAT transcription factor, DNA-binding domain and STAT transcription factor, coiled coil domain-containing protein [Strongyloides ratti]CEF71220.1 SH2 domain and p53-like transcription factor, DNA-binding domain and EF-hand domain pair and STAT transcription factor, DNA-binding, subdomain and STAT trans
MTITNAKSENTVRKRKKYNNLNGLFMSDLRSQLLPITNDCQILWDENKDLQGRFVNDLAELQRYQYCIAQLTNEGRRDQLETAQQAMMKAQKKASQLYQQLTDKRTALINKLNVGLQTVAQHQNRLISSRLYEWKNCQKLQQVGCSFENREQMLDEIQQDFELLADHSWQLRTFTSWLIDLLGRGPQLNDNVAQTFINSLNSVFENLTKLLCMLVSQSFVVAYQPDPVLKTQHKFMTEVRLLIGDRLGVKQQLVNANVTVTIIAEEEARQLSIGEIFVKDLKSVGNISNDYEKLTLDDKGHMSARFNNSKLTRIAHRKPPPKAFQAESKIAVQTATDQKYALLFHISMFQLGNLGNFDVWALSLPLMVTVHGSQDCDAQAVILWHRAFGSVNRETSIEEIKTVSWVDLSHILKRKFTLFTGCTRELNDNDIGYLAEKLLGIGNIDHKCITFQRFAKQNIRDDVNFSFWEWFFCIMQLIKQKLLRFWDEGWLIGFISKTDASQKMMNSPYSTFLLRFSDTVTGAVSIGFVCCEDDGTKIPFHLAPFSIKDLDQLSLASRIATCPQLSDIKYLFPDIDKEEMLKYFDSEERNKSESPTGGYIQSEIVMVAKTTGLQKRSVSSVLNSSTPSPMGGVTQKIDWSPGEVLQNNNSMDCSDELVTMMSQNQLDSYNIESLLGKGFHPQLPTQPLQTADLSFLGNNFTTNPNNQYQIYHNQSTSKGTPINVKMNQYEMNIGNNNIISRSPLTNNNGHLMNQQQGGGMQSYNCYSKTEYN